VTRLRLVAATGLLLGVLAPVVASVSAAEPASTASWFFRPQQKGAPDLSAASGVAKGSYAVSFTGGLAQARTVLSLPVGDAVSGSLVLHVDAATSSAPESSHVQACPSDSGWVVEEGGPWADQPLFSCPPKAVGSYDAKTSTITVPLDTLLPLSKGGFLQVMLTPSEDPAPNTNLAPSPSDPTAPSWTVALDARHLVGLSGPVASVPYVPPPVELPVVEPAPGGFVGGPTVPLPPVGPIVPVAVPSVLPSTPVVATAPAQPVSALPEVALTGGTTPGHWWNPTRWPLALLVFLGVLGVYVPRRSGQQSVAAARRAMADAGEDVPALEVQDLWVRFGGVEAVRGVSFAVPQGQIVGLIGPNGAGKTTVLDAITRTVEATGSVAFFGADVTGLDTARRAELGLGRSFQDGRLFPSLTVRETLAVACEQSSARIGPLAGALGAGTSAANERRLTERTDELISLMGLTAYGDKFLSELSTGSRRIVDLAAMIAHGARLLLLDEPSSGIAQRETEALGPVLLRLREQLGCTIVIIEHDMPLLRAVADRLIAFEVGEVISDGAPEEVLHDPVVVDAYLGTDSAAVNRSGAAVTA